MRPERVALMPDWPARMGEEMAALYLGISEPTLRERVKHGELPAPVREGGRVLWAKAQLDEFIAIQFGLKEKARVNSWD